MRIIFDIIFIIVLTDYYQNKASAQTMWPPSASAGRMGPGMMAPNITGSVNSIVKRSVC